MGDTNEIAFLWQHEHGSKWINYGDKQLLAINKAYLKGKKTVTLPGKDPKTELVVNFDKMYQKNRISGWEQRIRCCVYDDSFYVWLWKDDDGNWNCYVPSISLELESCYKRGKDLKFFYKDDYVFYLKEMKQKNVNTGTERDVLREKVSVKMSKCFQNIADSFTNALKSKIEIDTADAVDVTSVKRIKLDLNDKAMNSIKSEVPVDPECTQLASVAHVYSDETGVYDAMLNQTNLQQNNNKFYRIQLLKENMNNKYYVWFHWGRVGKRGQNNLIPFHTSLESAKEEFMSKFSAKTKNDWCDKDEFIKHPGKYELLKMDYDNKVVKKEITAVPEAESNLHPKIKNLLQMISNIDEIRKKIVKMKFDINKTPLGKLTLEQIAAGYSALKKIEFLLLRNQSGSKLVSACNDFYTRIPHDFGMRTPPVISTLADLQEKIELLEALSDIEINVQIQNGQRLCNENPIDYLYKTLECELKCIETGDEVYKLIDNYLQTTHGPTHNLYTMEIIDAYECTRSKEDMMFSDLGNKYLLWHGSRLTNFVGILKHGLRIAPPEAPATGYMFGKGIYFADISTKSANYCYPTKLKNEGLLILCEVSLGEQNVLYSANYDADVDTKLKNKQSVKGVGKFLPDPDEHIEISGVKVPKGKPIRNESDFDKCELNYNEFIVYNVHQVKIRYLVHIKFLFK